jgi:hypothetical protein
MLPLQRLASINSKSNRLFSSMACSIMYFMVTRTVNIFITDAEPKALSSKILFTC